jgi:hypothetical protein
MLTAVLRALYDDFTNSFYESVNRLEIADMLERDRLVPWDVKVLRDLVRLGLVKEERHALPKSGWQARGAEYRYSIDSDVLWCLLQMRRKHKSGPS